MQYKTKIHCKNSVIFNINTGIFDIKEGDLYLYDQDENGETECKIVFNKLYWNYLKKKEDEDEDV